MDAADQALFFAAPADFRAWLIANHATVRQLWVGFYKKDSARPSIIWRESVDEALCVGWIDGIRKGIDAESYKIRFTPRKPTSTWSAANIRRVAELTRTRRMQTAGLDAFARRIEQKSTIYSYENRATAKLMGDQCQTRRDPAEPPRTSDFGVGRRAEDTRAVNDIEIEVNDGSSAEIRDHVIGGLVTFNDAAAGFADYRELSVTARNHGKIVGGLLGHTNWDWLFVAQLWITDSARGQGIGRQLVREAELEARRRDCKHAHVDTFSFQAISFYERLGYAVFGRLDHYPAGHARYFLRKSELAEQ